MVYTDHKNLEYFPTTKILNRRQVRWAQELAEFDFKIIYRAGIQNGKANTLKRRPEFRPLRGDSSEFQPTLTVLKSGQLETPNHSKRTIYSTLQIKRLRIKEICKDYIALVKIYTANDKTYQDQLKLIRSKKETNGVTKKDGLIYYENHLWIPNDNDLLQQVAGREYDSKVAGHFGED